ncbi:MAG: PDZ domain-containing protein [Planctomycetota bacterium]|nr:PDZ domain-containing protein [Planctomycetota bacterium]
MTNHRPLLALLSVLLPCGLAAANVQPHAGMLRYPDISKDHIVFTYANDLWTVDRDGGMARPLASPMGREGRPRFNADGTRIAFTGNYDGGQDLYVIPTGGGQPFRVTHHPSREAFCDWSGDSLLFAGYDYQGLGQDQKLYTVSADGGLPTELPIPYGAAGAIHGDGTLLAYTPHSRDGRTWKRYRGGMASDLWIMDLEGLNAMQITDWEGTDTQPMWQGDTLYYLSDAGANHRLNIWKYDLATDTRVQVTDFAEFDVLWPSIGPGPDGGGEIIFQHGSDLMVLDLPTGATRVVEVTIPGDRPSVRHRRIETGDSIRNFAVSPKGKRVAVEARGEIWSLPSENGVARNMTNTAGVAERDPMWSPDGRWITYFSDESDEYELYMVQSDGKGERRQLTSDGTPFKHATEWSPDSKKLLYTGKAGDVHMIDVESGERRHVVSDTYAQRPSTSWSHDSKWLAYDRTDDNGMSSIWIYDTEADEHHRVTSPMFNDMDPAFDREGDYLYFTSGRTFRPEYSPVDGTFIYTEPGNLYAMPLRNDMDPVWTVEFDEVEWEEEKEEEPADEGAEETDDEQGEAEGDEAPADQPTEGDDAPKDDEKASWRSATNTGFVSNLTAMLMEDPISGTWNGSVEVIGAPAEMPAITFSMVLSMSEDYSVTGSVSIDMMGEEMDVDGNWNSDAGELTLSNEGDPESTVFKVDGNTMTGERSAEGMTMIMTATRAGGSETGDSGGDEDKSEKKDDEDEGFQIHFEDIESRAILLPTGVGSYSNLAVNSSNKLLYLKNGQLHTYDITDSDDKGSSANVSMGSFEMSANGKKIAHRRGGSVAIRNAGSGGSAKTAKTRGMVVVIDPREEWNQIFNDVWRTFRDYFYVENMHGVDWDAIRVQYAAMLPDVMSREDLNHVIGEMIAELNVGHAYRGGGDMDPGAGNVPVGLLAADFELADGAYRFKTIHTGGPWDADARGPLSMPGVDVHEGDYLLAVNGTPVDTAFDPHHALIGTAGQHTELTVSANPVLDDEARRVIVKPMRSDGRIRYRAWIERNRAYVDKATDGRVGYIYVPDTGVNGQNDLYRQFYGQSGKDALIIDERWNGGGQLPNRFIELLNRPVTNWFALRDGKDWKVPQASHSGPKCMLINGRAGSGGDMFPWLFRQAGLGPLIGTRTWGGLVGISGNPSPIDGGYIRVPRFGFYENDGTWGVEGHGVDPDIEVIADPSLMVGGGDPQLDVAIAEMLQAIEDRPFVPAVRPADPDRSGMGLPIDEY